MTSFKKKVKMRRKGEEGEVAEERIKILFKLAEESALKNDLEKADDYVKKARKIGMKTRVKVPRELKRKFCKYCYAYLLPGKTSQVRINSQEKKVVVKCKNCGRGMYFPYLREVKRRRQKK